MRPETKERADTFIGSVLRGSFTLCQATAGDMRGRNEAETQGETRHGRGGLDVGFRPVRIPQQLK